MAIPNASIYATSLESVAVAITAPASTNPTGTLPQFSFLSNLPPIQPAPSAYVNGFWQGTVAPYIALCLVGPGTAAGTALAQGQYNVWVKVTASPEVVVKWCGILQVT